MGNQLQGFEQFEGIRTHIDADGEIWYCVVDVVGVLAETPRANNYWTDMKRRDKNGELHANCVKFSIPHRTNGRKYKMDCAQQQGILQIIQLIPSPKAEPFRRWMAMLGDRRLNEMRGSLIEQKREQLRMAGFSEEEITIRLDALRTGNTLDAEWSNRGVIAAEKGLLADEIHKGTFEGMTRLDHANHKQLDAGEILDDHMTNLEVAFSNLGQALTIEEINHHNPQGFDENQEAATKGGASAGKLRRIYEEEKGIEVISDKSPLLEKRKGLSAPTDPESEEEES